MKDVFSPTSVSGYQPLLRDGYGRSRSLFGDARLAAQYQSLRQQMLDQQRIVVHQLASNRNEADRYYRFLGHEKVSLEELIYTSCSIPELVQSGRHVLVLGDSSSFNLKSHMGRIQDSHRIGVIEDNRTRGFLAHPHLALDAENGDILGVADLLFWCRKKVKKGQPPVKVWQDRESYKWALGMTNAAQVLVHARQQTYVFDRDADSEALFHHATELSRDLQSDIHMVIRRRHDRVVSWADTDQRISEVLAQSPLLGSYELAIPKLNHYSSTRGKWIRRKARTASMEVRLAEVTLPFKQGGTRQLWVVEAKETSPVPVDEAPIHWVLLTTHPTEGIEQALKILSYYTLRWIIEQLFRTMKSEGLELEATELETFDGILRQTIMAFTTAARVLQLVYARDRFDAQPIEEVFDQQEQTLLEKLNPKLEGKTQKQQNPFPKNQLSWAAWIIARLGGWKGYRSQRPPGPIIFRRGLQKFDIYKNAFDLFNPPDG